MVYEKGKYKKQPSFRLLESLLLYFLRSPPYVLRCPPIRSPHAFYDSGAKITEMSRRGGVATLSRSFTFSSVDQTSRRCCQFSPSSSLQFQNDSKNHPFHLQCTHDPKIRYRAIMHLFRYKIELKRRKDVGMT